MHLNASKEFSNSRVKRWFSRTTETSLLFPVFAIAALVAIWGTTLHLNTIERTGAQRAAAVSSRALSETYEAQVVRALREIDLTLKSVKYAYELGGRPDTLQELKTRALLPPDLLFVVSIADRHGDVIASTRAYNTDNKINVANQDYFQMERGDDMFSVGQPRKNPGSEEWSLYFTRRLNAPDGSFAGVAVVMVDAAYFVSGYDSATLGEHGVLGILGTDGVFRARRSGEAIFASDVVDYASVLASVAVDGDAVVLTNPWDGVRRYTSARALYDFPLTVIVGLSEIDQLAAVRQRMQEHLNWAGFSSILLILVVAALARLSRQLSDSRRRAHETQLAHAQRVEYLAYHDGLTTLPNRSLFSKLLNQAVSEATRYDRQLAVLFLDLDHFKQINDTLGHEAGDQLLQEVARRLRSCLRDSDTVARLGGDEFVVLLPDLSEEMYAATVAQKILVAIAKQFVLSGQEFRITASIGICIYPEDGMDEQTLMKNADIAMYHAKEQSKNNFQFYSEKLNVTSLERLTLELGLRHALEHNEYLLHYQAKKELRSGLITGVEVLLRWQHPELGMLLPMQFVPIAEETGLIVPIGKWVLKTACEQSVAWRKQGLPDLSIAINLTERQFFDDHLLADIAAILHVTGMQPSLLELEINEGVLLRNADRALRVLIKLKAMNVRIAVDDFGVGYSSLTTLKQFPLDTVKIHRSFIRDASSVSEDKALTEAIMAMGRTLSLTVVAQGVETKEQADFLDDYVCDEIQGFYFNKPLSAAQFAAALLEDSAQDQMISADISD
ncbi:bifunctional diguanylate cyclase/phosphodiesterase [Glaciimonas sp. GG7]